ncbi:apolipoprotein D-like [Mytilus galloprovincialis]|uniref:apolipoprotein D-like n=1 Tax=Mytilus galloprovincialis TaxID=29158 RepID=UPI003F7C5408
MIPKLGNVTFEQILFVTMKLLISLCLFCISADAFFIDQLFSNGCKSPSPAQNFTNQQYNGLWYEVGKMQTAGGAAFEKDCVCTTIDIKPKSGTSDYTAINSCRKLSPTGNFLNATGTLSGEGPSGHWKEGFFPLAPKADYTIIYLDDNYAIEYDCTSVFGVTNYCIHILSRTPTAQTDMVQKLKTFAIGLGLNTENLDYQETLQKGCW